MRQVPVTRFEVPKVSSLQLLLNSLLLVFLFLWHPLYWLRTYFPSICNYDNYFSKPVPVAVSRPPSYPNLNCHRYPLICLHPSPSQLYSSWDSKKFETTRKYPKNQGCCCELLTPGCFQGCCQFNKSDFLDHLKRTSTTTAKLLLPAPRDLLLGGTVVPAEAIGMLLRKLLLALWVS